MYDLVLTVTQQEPLDSGWSKKNISATCTRDSVYAAAKPLNLTIEVTCLVSEIQEIKLPFLSIQLAVEIHEQVLGPTTIHPADDVKDPVQTRPPLAVSRPTPGATLIDMERAQSTDGLSPTRLDDGRRAELTFLVALGLTLTHH